MKLRIIDELLIDQIKGLMVEFGKAMPEWSRVCRAIRDELESLPIEYEDDESVPDWTRDGAVPLDIEFLLSQFEHMMSRTEKTSWTLGELLNSAGLRLSDRLN